MGQPRTLRLLLAVLWSCSEVGGQAGPYAHEFSSRAELLAAVDSWLADPTTAAAEYGPISDWNTGKITDFSELFCATSFRGICKHYNSAARNFNDDITRWNTSAVTTTSNMFYSAGRFNQPIGNWDTSSVTSMVAMFRSSSFNQPIGSWDTGKVELFAQMFSEATAFNQPIGDWNTASVRTTSAMFHGARSFNQPLSSVVKNGSRLLCNVDCPWGKALEFSAGASVAERDTAWFLRAGPLTAGTFRRSLTCTRCRHAVPNQTFIFRTGA